MTAGHRSRISIQFGARPALLLLAIVFLAGSTHGQEASGKAAPEPSRQGRAVEDQSREQTGEEADESYAYKHSHIVKMLGAKLGMSSDTAATTFEVINFGLLAGLTGLFLVRTLPKTLRQRTSVIQKQLVDARMATEEAASRMNSVEDRLSKLDDEIAAMRAQSSTDAAVEEERVKDAIHEEKQRIVALAEQEIASATIQARRQIQTFAADLAIDQAAKKLVVTAETDRLLVQSFARRLMVDEGKEGQN